MKNVFLGEYIKQRRLDLGLTQEQLCDGICEPMTLSRLENGKQTPSRNRINALLQRLGLPDDRYFALLSKNELEMEALQKEIVALNTSIFSTSSFSIRGVSFFALVYLRTRLMNISVVIVRLLCFSISERSCLIFSVSSFCSSSYLRDILEKRSSEILPETLSS